MSADRDDPDTPAEARLRQLLAPLREDAPRPSSDLGPRVLRTVRWQRAVREVAQAVGILAGVVADGVRLLVRPRREPS